MELLLFLFAHASSCAGQCFPSCLLRVVFDKTWAACVAKVEMQNDNILWLCQYQTPCTAEW